MKTVYYKGQRFIVNMVTGTVRKPDGKFLLKDKELKKEIIKMVSNLLTID